MDLKNVIEKDIQTELLRAKVSPQDIESHIRSAFIHGMMLGARLQAELPHTGTDHEGWCAVPETL